MIKTKKINVSVNGMNYKYYGDLGYNVCTIDGKMDRNKKILVDVMDAKYSRGCGPKVEVICDICSNLFTVKIGTILNQLKSKETCNCKNCNDSISARIRCKTINPGGKKLLQSVEVKGMCFGGCGLIATHKSNSGNLWCNDLGGLICSESQKKAIESFKNNGCNIGIRNGMFGKTHSIESKNVISSIMKKKIKEGSFTPNITNSWANSKTFLSIDDCEYYFRSSWEAIFWLKNKRYEYEKIRIPYYNSDNIKRNYIVDFVDYDTNILFEIKPNSEKKNINNQLKAEAADNWARNNGFEYKIITEDWFKENLSEDDINEFKLISEKIHNGLKGLLR